jgi:CubicO group peptidase (beta-lactamase class C family)
MKNITLFCCLLLISASLFGQKQDTRLVGLDKELNEVLKTWNAAGFSVAVVEKDKIIYAKGFGFRDYENKLPADANTLYEIGSSTKAFTSAVLGTLRAEGLVDFNEKPQKYIPYLNFYNDAMNNSIKLKDLMSHQTGLPRHDYSWYVFNSTDKDSLLQRVQYQEPFADVREQWFYNNFMFLAQGVIAEKITGKSWEENIKERFFKPLNMQQSVVDIEGMKQSKNAALGYELKDDKIKKMKYYDISGMSPAGSIGSSVNEMSNWLMAWINNGIFMGNEVIPAAYVDEAKSSHAVVGAGLPDANDPDMFFANYGYGWFTASYKGHYRVEHGGNIDGFSASVSFFPTDSIGIVVLVNQNASSVPAVVRNTIADRVLEGVRVENWNKKLKKKRDEAKAKSKEAGSSITSNQVAGTKTSHPLVAFSGEYENKGYGKFRIALEKDSLFAIFPKMKFWLEHYHYDVFKPRLVNDDGSIEIPEIDEVSGLTFSFLTNTTGDIKSLLANFEPALEALEFDRKPIEIAMDSKSLSAYVGDYDLMGQTIKIYVKNDTTLFAFVAGQPEYELLATGTDTFVIKILEGFKLKFSSLKKKLFQEVTFMQPNGNFKATRKTN